MISAPLHIAVVNPKGGCGKTTLTAQLAGFFASNRLATAVVDHDPQKSLSDWLKCRPVSCAPISLLREAKWRQHAVEFDVVLHDIPASFPIEKLEAMTEYVQRFLIPILPSPTDIRAAARFFMDLNRNDLLSGDWRMAMVANRAKANVVYTQVLRDFTDMVNIPLIGQLRDTQNYIRALDTGVTIFDLNSSKVAQDMEHWAPILEWILDDVNLPIG